MNNSPRTTRHLATASQPMDRHRNAALLMARILMALIFIAAGLDKMGRYAATVMTMQAAGVPGALLPAVIALELVGGLAILLGARTRPAALGLAVFCIVSAALFHHNFADALQAAMFMKNLAMAGGFLSLAVAGAGAASVDARSRSARAATRIVS